MSRVLTPEILVEHRRRLLLSRRCPECAEPAPGGAILRGEVCAHCQADLLITGDGEHAAKMVRSVREDWNQWRVMVYAVVGVSSLFAGAMPLGGAVFTVFAMVAGHVLLLRRPLRWLSPARRVTTRMAVKLWFALLGLGSFLAGILAAPFLALAGAGALASAVVAVGATGLYLEGGLLLVERRIAREAQSARLDVAEWAIPVALLGSLLVAGVVGVLLVWGSLNALVALDVPRVADIARFLLGVE